MQHEKADTGAIPPEKLKAAFRSYFQRFTPEEIKQRVTHGLAEAERQLARQEEEIRNGTRVSFPRFR
jgi:hypothetical protein